jgi:hypothetical protein
MFDKTIDELLCVCVCVLQILITKDKILPFSNFNIQLLIKFAIHLYRCGGTPVAKHCSKAGI